MIKTSKRVNKFTSLSKLFLSLDVGESVVVPELHFTNSSIKQACTRLKQRHGKIYRTKVGVTSTTVTRIE